MVCGVRPTGITMQTIRSPSGWPFDLAMGLDALAIANLKDQVPPGGGTLKSTMNPNSLLRRPLPPGALKPLALRFPFREKPPTRHSLHRDGSNSQRVGHP